jgi:hypothetical protein
MTFHDMDYSGISKEGVERSVAGQRVGGNKKTNEFKEIRRSKIISTVTSEAE